MNHPLENVLAGMAALLIVGAAMTAAVSVPPAPATAPVQTDAAALALPVLA
ncbi:MAG: hypothetical protein KJ703_11220 [Alphaproteobacteria bacterium]|nr:hypothetical protein [Alphaproteobacteria bacterium]MBU1757528.1 hypothetical protein [Alphaproteobacteria bacterium]MBU2033943.1 hypothetical protein [Alphaproteobacteria bacterium]